MDRRLFLAAAMLALAACGGGSTDAPAPAPPPAKISPPPPDVVAEPRTAVVFIGDSLTAAMHELPDGWINAGVSGQVTVEMLARFDHDVLALRPAVVHILGGTNDVRSFVNPSIDSIAEMARRASADGACVIIGTVPPNSIWGVNPDVDNTTGNASINRFNMDLKNLAAAYGYLIADYHSVLSFPDGTIDQSLFYDGIHENAAGLDKMWALVGPLVQQCKLRLGI